MKWLGDILLYAIINGIALLQYFRLMTKAINVYSIIKDLNRLFANDLRFFNISMKC